MSEPIKKVKISSGEGLPRLPNGLPIPATLPPIRPQQEEESKSVPAGVKGDITRRRAGGKMWTDASLAEWPEDDYRAFVGDLGPEVNDEVLSAAFHKYSSFLMAKIVRDKKTGKSKGFGFLSFGNAEDYTRAMREMNGKHVGSRPITLSKSKWQKRSLQS